MNSTKSDTALMWGLWSHVVSYVVANAAQVVVWWIFDPEHFFWPLWSILAWGVGLAFHIWAVYRRLRD
ncbi:2TM domain-containing protein [Micromonospora sp. NBC_01796]|uniref:2TM domain-containing protein n=1 Tax=Micromonospora sp. NBC_01796 TaxID=2975987 RepID=UPI002DD9F27E|nr:2TM domain-containing protein [Micromonospora sp. NBC_01796]WSA84056.1 2TM domain-containing protein [Micromonospora sp. NBC_01796]